MKNIGELLEASKEDLPDIYCDMDGVLADFKTAAVKTNGMSINKWMNVLSAGKH